MSRKKDKKRGRRHRSRRVILSKLGMLLSVLGLLSVFLAAAIATASFFSSPAARSKQLGLSSYYLAGGAVVLLVRWLIGLARKVLFRRTGGSTSPPIPAVRRRSAKKKHRRSRRTSSVTSDTYVSDRSSGAALILSLFVLALLAALLVQVQLTARSNRRHAEAALSRDRLQHAATDAVQRTLEELANDTSVPGDTNSPWASPREFQDPTGIDTRIAVSDAQRFFDLNNLAVSSSEDDLRSPQAILMDLMTLCGDFTPIERVEALTDWLDSDEEGFYETGHYGEADPPYAAANRILYGLGELLWVEGFDHEYFQRRTGRTPGGVFKADLMECIIVLPVDRAAPIPVNVNTASREVLQGIFGLDQDEHVDRILKARLIRPMESMDEVAMLTDPLVMTSIRPYLDIRSHLFRVQARSFLDGAAFDIDALAQRAEDGTVQVVSWSL